MKITQFIFSFLLAMFLCGFGCSSSKPTPDPLVGFHFSSLNNLKSDKAITDDYQDYIQKLPSEESKSAGPIEYFENATGQHAILIWIGINGTVWRHILIYDKDYKRIKTIKYASGDYHS